MTLAQAFIPSNSDAYSLQATSLVRSMRGHSGPILVEANDGLLYVVKMWGNPSLPNLLANEFLGSTLSRAVGLPTAAFRPIELSASFINSLRSSIPTGGYGFPLPGLHYASQMVQAKREAAFIIEYLPTNMAGFVENRAAFLGMYLLDLCFKHRDARQAVFIKSKGSPNSQAVFIDYGHMFGGPNWDVETPLRSSHHPTVALYDGLSSAKAVNSWLKTFASQLPAAIERGFKSLPSEWYIGDLVSVRAWLHHRLETLPRVIEQELDRASIFRKHTDAAVHVQSSRICQVGT